MKPYLQKLILPIFFIIIALLFLQPFDGNPDFYHHINSGREIIKEGTFPYFDKLTHTANGNYWVAYAWGSGVIFYLFFQYLGPISVSLVCTLIGFFILLLIYILLRSYAVSKTTGLVSTAFAAVLIATRFPQRPEIFTYPFLVSLLIIDKVKEKHPKIIFFLPVIFLLWTNLYGSSVILGLGLISALILKQFITDKSRILPQQKLFYALSLAAFPLALVNPNGINSLLYIFFIPEVAKYEGEWGNINVILNETPESYIIVYQYLILIYLLYLSTLLLISILSFKKLKQTNLLLIILGFAVFIPIIAFRQTPIAAIFSIPLFALLLNHQKQIIKIGVLVITLIMAAILIWIKNPLSWGTHYSPQSDLVQFIKEHNLKGKAFNHQNTGSFLSYYFFPDILVFFDTRDDLFQNNKAFKDLYNAQMGNSSIMPLLEKYQIDLVVADFFTDALNYKDLFNSSSWAVVYFNDRYFIALPAKAAEEKSLTELKAINLFSPGGAQPGLEKEAGSFYKTLVDSFPTNSNKLLLAQTFLAQENYSEAIETLKSLEIPKDPAGILLKKQQDYFLLKAYLESKDCQNSSIYLNELEKDIQGKFIFNPSRKLQIIDEDLKAIYYRSCQKDHIKADQYMKQYLNRTDINPKEKIKFQQSYETL